jgi:hypothetical protein
VADRVVSPRLRMAVSGGLFIAWLGFLLYLVIQTQSMVVLSRSQFLVANLFVAAELTDESGKPGDKIIVAKVYWCADPADEKKEGSELRVLNLPDARSSTGYAGAGKYLLPIYKRVAKTGEVDYLVPPVPMVPGYAPPADGPDVRIYPLTPQTEAQLTHLVAERKK